MKLDDRPDTQRSQPPQNFRLDECALVGVVGSTTKAGKNMARRRQSTPYCALPLPHIDPIKLPSTPAQYSE